MEEYLDPAAADAGRRRFLEASIGIMLGLGGLAIAPPLVLSFVGPTFRPSKEEFTAVGPVADLKGGAPTTMPFSQKTADAYLEETATRSVWVIKGESDEQLTVFSPICPHLGCQYNWNAGNKEFMCPCHGSIFSEDGKVVGGPAPRGLDTLPYKIEQGVLYVKWERFKLGVAQKVTV